MPSEPNDVADSVPQPGITAIVVVADDRAGLEATVRGLAENAVLPGLHVCLVAREPTPESMRAELQRIAGLQDARHAWSIASAAADADFGETLRAIAAAHPGRDFAVIASGAVLPFAWDARLAKAAYAAPNVAAAIPMCDVSALFALVDEKYRTEARADAARIDRSAYCMGDRSYYEIPGIHAVCAYLRRDALDAALPFLPAGGPDPRAALDGSRDAGARPAFAA